ncbi:MFS transporter [Desulfosoma sp.]|uniref:MFS transporter n=1 Tax=Desulfosoma sp. TaxID=2603217 RepID=UPI0040498061
MPHATTHMKPTTHPTALHLVMLLGVVSLFADMTYEGARSLIGPYLAALGAGATAVGVVAGIGEAIGYGLRIVSGLITDRTHRYWTMTLAGYAVNLLAVPALALARNWKTAAVLIMTERFGKAIRTPARDAILSHAAHGLGRGWAFGLHEAMDQIGAMIGPIIVAAVLAWKGRYEYGFAVLALPALLALAVLIIARISHPQPHNLEPTMHTLEARGLRSTFWFYLMAVACIALGFADFPLVAFHLKTKGIVADQWIPVIYAGAMGVEALSALVLGRLYDQKGVSVLVVTIGVSAWSAPFVFVSGPVLVILGIVLWGIGMGAQESIIRAVVADLVPWDQRATGYGIFNAGFGLAWFAGSAFMGLLYDRSLMALAAFSVAVQFASMPWLHFVRRRLPTTRVATDAKP